MLRCGQSVAVGGGGDRTVPSRLWLVAGHMLIGKLLQLIGENLMLYTKKYYF